MRAAVAMSKQYGMDPIDDFQHVHRKRMTLVRFDNHSERGINLGFTEFFRKESLDIIDQIMIDCKENWRQVLLKIKPFSIMLPPFNNIDENLFEDLLKLLGENFACSSLIGEITILKEEQFNGKPVALM